MDMKRVKEWAKDNLEDVDFATGEYNIIIPELAQEVLRLREQLTCNSEEAT